jgi:hypothetical protein
MLEEVRPRLEQLNADWESKRELIEGSIKPHWGNMDVVAKGLANYRTQLLRGEMDLVDAQCKGWEQYINN